MTKAFPHDAEQNRAWQSLVAARRLAHKTLADQEQPQAGDRMRSTADPDARRGKHGGWYDGYLLDLMIDADSELITAMDVLPANGAEAANAAELVRQEEAVHANDVQGLSIDGVAFQGPVLRELEAPEGPGLDVYVPPRPESPTAHFTPQDFREDSQQGTLTCPAGQTAAQRERNAHDTAWKHEDLVPLGTRIRTRLKAEPASRDELFELLTHTLSKAGNATLMTPELMDTLIDHSAGNYRLLMTMGAELLAYGMAHEVEQLDEKLYLRRPHRRARRRPVHPPALCGRRRLLRRQLHGAPADRAGDPGADGAVHADRANVK